MWEMRLGTMGTMAARQQQQQQQQSSSSRAAAPGTTTETDVLAWDGSCQQQQQQQPWPSSARTGAGSAPQRDDSACHPTIVAIVSVTMRRRHAQPARGPSRWQPALSLGRPAPTPSKILEIGSPSMCRIVAAGLAIRWRDAMPALREDSPSRRWGGGTTPFPPSGVSPCPRHSTRRRRRRPLASSLRRIPVSHQARQPPAGDHKVSGRLAGPGGGLATTRRPTCHPLQHRIGRHPMVATSWKSSVQSTALPTSTMERPTWIPLRRCVCPCRSACSTRYTALHVPTCMSQTTIDLAVRLAVRLAVERETSGPSGPGARRTNLAAASGPPSASSTCTY